MPVIAILQANETVESDDDMAPTARRTPGDGGGVVPTRLAGYTYDGAHYCPECAKDVEVTSSQDGETYTVARFPVGHHDPNGFGVGIVSGTDEIDYPGGSCHECHRRLDTNVLVYDDGGAHPEPVVEALDPDRARPPASAFVLEDDGTEVKLMLAEDFGSHGDAGDVSWVPKDDVADYE